MIEPTVFRIGCMSTSQVDMEGVPEDLWATASHVQYGAVQFGPLRGQARQRLISSLVSLIREEGFAPWASGSAGSVVLADAGEFPGLVDSDAWWLGDIVTVLVRPGSWVSLRPAVDGEHLDVTVSAEARDVYARVLDRAGELLRRYVAEG